MDWFRFLEENNIHFVTRGPNTKRGELSIQCPMCGEDDPSEHLGINPDNGKWGCHRDASHRGKAPRTLIKALLRCSSPQAGLIVKQYSHSDPDTLEAALAVLEADTGGNIQHDEDLITMARKQALGPQFNDFNKIKARGITKRFFTYLQGRGYDDPQAIIHDYELRCAMTGRYKDRIIIPVRLNGELLGWTSRAIGAPKNAPRYLASNQDIKNTVFNYDSLKDGGERLFIVEGPFDAIKLDSYQKEFHNVDFRATCTFGTSVILSQIVLLRNLVKKFKETWVLFDTGAESSAYELSEWLGVPTALLPHQVSDPGELPDQCLTQCGSNYFNGHFNYTPALHESFYNVWKNSA